MEVRAYLPTVLIFDLQNLRKSGRPDFPEFQPVTILVFKIIFSMCLFSANREEIYFIDANRIQNQEYEYTHRCSERSICWNLCTDFINVDKFEAFSAILDKEKSKIFWGTMPLHPPRKRLCRGNSCLQRSLGQNGENVLISDFQMLASMSESQIQVCMIRHQLLLH